jgi:hypothetical protein
LGDGENGAPVCALSRRASRRLRRQLETSWHNPGTVASAVKTARTVTLRKIKDFLVAREGIEPPTRGFSVRVRAVNKTGPFLPRHPEHINQSISWAIVFADKSFKTSRSIENRRRRLGQDRRAERDNRDRPKQRPASAQPDPLSGETKLRVSELA